ncbi:DUF6443 domain-containing protein [Chryseobacterium indoltheticum]|uniref:RHS repeat-associated core domain n=1 Tax=Chryseobacterium indoltheticum TaxID=254 RepID=A0A381FQ40_9FLAO|nr:DUF6443 domain-containing protein [Chryseobacterium indoltheticum]SUX48488.1 RHS repeat-associated core domain [Chryseobacterium indoltheticum]
MKKLIISFLLFAAHCIWAQSLPSNENYIYTKNYLSEDGTKKTETVQYFDGLGRATEVVQVKSTPSGKDLVAPVIYDQFGRQSKTLLPIPVATSNYGIHNTTEADVNNYYGVANAFSEQKIEASPLARVFEVANAGSEWAMSSGHTTKMQYLTNEPGDQVKKYNTEVSWANATLTTSISSISLYAPNQLSKNVVTDEDGKMTTEFKNSEGQTVLLRKGSGSAKLDTYYIYNVYNQLAFVISPKAEQQITANNNVITSQILNELCYQYVYDNRFRQVEKKLPGKGWEYMVYDQQNRMVASQDANMKSNIEQPNRWLFSRYDKFGRVVYTGRFAGGTRLEEQNKANAKGLNNEIRNTTSFTLNGQEIFYTNTAYPSAAFVPYSVNYYDSYPVTSHSFNFYPPNTDILEFVMTNTQQNISSNGVNSIRSLKSLPTSSYIKNLDDDSWSASHVWYDRLLRPVGSRSINHLGGYTNTENQLDFSGTVLKANTYHKKTNADPSEVIIKERFVYDDQFRVKQHYHQVNGNTEELLSDYTYNDLGQVTNKKVGNNLQSVDYIYNIRGWVTKVNNPANLGTDLFGYELKFAATSDASVAQANYNGNITEMIWKNASEDVLKRYSYQYDPYNRLTAALYQEPNSTLPQNGLYNETMNYDVNGNITDLKRNQKGYDGFTEEIDDLLYAYNGNKLTSVVDHKVNYSGYPDTSGNTISYDLNGNMTNHVDKGILEIKYNDLNLPNYIKFNNFVSRTEEGDVYRNLSYAYRADGVKIKKIHHFFSGKKQTDAFRTTEYIDGFQYRTETGIAGGTIGLQFFATSEGYFDFVNNRYIYQYVDHLGNVRLSFTREGGEAITVEKADYYAFGLKYGGYAGDRSGANYNYEYNGKELQEETGMYDYGARFYMPDIGRWGVVDPLAEQMRRHSPYNYAYNNPITFIDPDGRRPEAGQSGIYYDWDMGQYIDSSTGSVSSFDAAMTQYSSNSGSSYVTHSLAAFGGSGGGGPSFQFPKGTEAYYQKNYPAFFDFVKNQLPNMVADSKFMKALSSASGFSMDELTESFKYGKGMYLKALELPFGNAEYLYGGITEGNTRNTSAIDISALDWFEKANRNPQSIEGLTNLMYMSALIAHETGHWGDDVKRTVKYDSVGLSTQYGDVGNFFEHRAFGGGIGSYKNGISGSIKNYVQANFILLQSIFK